MLISPEESVKKFILDVGLPLNQVPTALGVTSKDFMNWWSGLNPALIQTRELQSLGQYLNIDEAEIVQKSYDKTLIRARIFHGMETLPERYAQNQFSYLRSSAHILKYLRLTRGQSFSDSVLRKLNVSPVLYDNLNNRISLNYFMDLLEALSESGFDQHELDNVACVLFLSLEFTPLGEKFKNARTHFECYEVLANNVQLFDSNYLYTFDIDRTRICIRSFLHFDNHPHIDWSQARIDRLLRYRRVLIGCYPFLSKLTPIFPEVKVERSKYGIGETYTIKFDGSGSNRLFSVASSAADN